MSEAQSQAPPAESESLVCPACGYDLRGISSDKCPECGLSIDLASMSFSRIPWEHRQTIGQFVAFWRTVRLVLIQPGKFAREVNRPIDYRSARRFQLVAVTLGWLAQCAWTFAPLIYDSGPRIRGGWFVEGAMIWAVSLAMWLYHWMASTIPSSWFRPAGLSVERQNRAVALSYYASAALAVLVLPAVMFLTWIALEAANPNGIPSQLELLLPLSAVIVAAAIFIDGYLLTLYLMRVTTQSDVNRTLAMAVVLPMQWFMCGILAAVLPMVVYYLALAIVVI